MNSKHSFSQQSVARSAGTFGAVTMLSRVMGLVRDMVSASLFGTSGVWDAFVIAFTIPNMFRMMLGEGALSGAFIPLFSKYLHEQGEKSAWEFANKVLTSLSIALIGIILIGWCILGGLLYVDLSDRIHEVILLSIMLLPYMFFICIVGVLMGILNTFYRFVITAFGPVMLNVVMIAAMIILVKIQFWTIHTKVVILTLSVLAGGVCQFGSHFWIARKEGLRYRFIFSIRDESMRQIWLLMVPAVLGLSITQINLVVNRLLALAIGEGAASTLYYSNRLIQLPIGVFGVALATTSFPLMAKHAAQNDLTEFRKVLTHVLKLMLFISIPATIGLMALSLPIIRMIFERNQFDTSSTIDTANVLMFYSLGLVAYCSNITLTRGFYSFQDTKTPVRIGLISLVVNVVLNIALMVPLKQGGLALATSISAFVGFFMMIHALIKKTGSFLTPDLFHTLKTSFVSSVVMAVVSYGSAKIFSTLTGSRTWNNIISGIVPVIIGCGVYLIMAYLLKSEELHSVLRIFKLRLKRTQK